MAIHQRHRSLPEGRLLHTRTSNRSGAERDKGRENTNLRILEWMRDVQSKGDEGQSIQQVDGPAEQHVKTEDPLSSVGRQPTGRSRYHQII